VCVGQALCKSIMRDIRDDILSGVSDRTVTACVIADDEGLVVETRAVEDEAKALGLTLKHILNEGSRVKPGDEIVRLDGRPKQIVMCEERLIGMIAKPSGIATAARRFVDKAGQRPRIVSGAWKKMPWHQKEMIQRAVVGGGADCRIANAPFLYLDKNYVRMLGGVKRCLKAVADLNGYLKVVQLRGEYNEIGLEAMEAVGNGADIIFVDTGKPDDLELTVYKLREMGWRDRVKIAFGGGVQLEDVPSLKAMDADILDIGRPIIDAPLLDMRMEVIATRSPQKKRDHHDGI
jgi:nicotinate-nucleotide pyrophosphorylase (carboxylating)